MGKKRYYYDSKGRSRGYSSDQSPQSRNAKALLLAVPLIAVMGMCSKESKDTPAQSIEATSEPKVTENGVVDDAVQPNAGVEYVDEVQQAEATEAVAQPQRSGTTEEYLQKNYVNGNLKCPIDAQEFNSTLCEEGQELACNYVRKCDPESTVVSNAADGE